MEDSLKPRIITGMLFSVAIVLFWMVSPDISAVQDQQYAELVLVFTSIVAASSLYFIHDILSEVTGK